MEFVSGHSTLVQVRSKAAAQSMIVECVIVWDCLQQSILRQPLRDRRCTEPLFLLLCRLKPYSFVMFIVSNFLIFYLKENITF